MDEEGAVYVIGQERDMVLMYVVDLVGHPYTPFHITLALNLQR